MDASASILFCFWGRKRMRIALDALRIEALASRRVLMRDLWSAALFLGALGGSVFFQGFETTLFSAVQIALLLWLASVLWVAHDAPLSFARSPITWLATLFWGWLVLTLLWTPIWYVSVFDVWWVGTLMLVYWTCLLNQRRELVWRFLAPSALAFGTVLALAGVYQFFLHRAVPHASFLNINSYAGLLNLIALPLAGYLLLPGLRGRVGRGWEALLWVTFGLLVFVLALTQSRGASLSFAAGLVLLLVAGLRPQSRPRVLPLLLLVGIAYLAATLLWGRAMTTRFADLAEPLTVTSMQARWLIWQQTWEMLKLEPWWGIGSGLFSLAYTAHRAPGDSSAGFLVHNDYLQLWLEAGLPALLLMVGLLVTVAWTWVRMLRVPGAVPDKTLEASALFAGLFAVAMHSFVDFNFHVLTILILAGAALARFQVLAGAILGSGAVRLRVLPWLSRPVYRLIIVLLLAFPLVYFASISLAVHASDEAHELVRQGRLNEADATFRRAHRYYPPADNVLVNHADLYRHILTLLPAARVDERRELYARANQFLDQAEAANRFRALTPLVRARLIQQNTDLAGGRSDAQIEDAYRRALALNPRFFQARYAYAKYLETKGQRAAAHRVLEEGLGQYYPSHQEIVPYLALAASYRRAAGDAKGAAELGARIEAAMLNSGWQRVPVADVERPLMVTGEAAAKADPRQPAGSLPAPEPMPAR